ncbi:CAAD domains of cyanobacterial aminoacyl-tRNA synthetase-domain-containing protein [Dunaliella salina]|uniref:CAAD domains of cyanobacterial aminoacyl-tRNA synthetase-domain-containing protein n=1 Tax=Dunaliella salina TaxID=3046 RepID=A0ABQ7GSU1_DUNSA|nr:CAAD domains of cyanobacterial aminoacyl-tRNA synthetase-domain-containing protein [Dunaliella salina]|eukprot:KAF5837686.1 CAAD domains of cyanobacterial aminoacyl-tRNA synthetase-domain-containing protein [Dunaliella salina]
MMMMQRSACTQTVACRGVCSPRGLGPRLGAPRQSAIAPQRRVLMRAGSESKSDEFDSDKVIKDLQAQWDAIENKPQVALYATGGVFGIWLTANIISAINQVPLLPKMFEFIGLGYSTWFTYRYLLFQGSREELIKDVEELKSKITGK